jgi:hypothetical protein
MINNNELTDGELQHFNKLAINWLLGAQFLKKDNTNGFFPRGTTIIRRDDIYPEITGYGASTLSLLYFKYKNTLYAERSICACDALIRYMQPNGAIPSIINKDGSFEDIVYSFDQGMIANGILDTYNVLSNESKNKAKYFKDYGLDAVDFLLKIQKEDGNIPKTCFLNGTTKENDNLCVFGKIIIPILKAFKITGKIKYKNAAELIANYIIKKFQKNDGAFSLNEYVLWDNRVHYHCYAVNGMLSIYDNLGGKEFLKSANKAAILLKNIQKENGGFYYELPGKKQIKIEDPVPVAQALDIWLYLVKKEDTYEYITSIKKALRYLLDHQYNKRIYGLTYGGIPPMVPYRKKYYACTVAVQFSLDTINKYEILLNELISDNR